jgi:hypothetical protein
MRTAYRTRLPTPSLQSRRCASQRASSRRAPSAPRSRVEPRSPARTIHSIAGARARRRCFCDGACAVWPCSSPKRRCALVSASARLTRRSRRFALPTAPRRRSPLAKPACVLTRPHGYLLGYSSRFRTAVAHRHRRLQPSGREPHAKNSPLIMVLVRICSKYNKFKKRALA